MEHTSSPYQKETTKETEHQSNTQPKPKQNKGKQQTLQNPGYPQRTRHCWFTKFQSTLLFSVFQPYSTRGCNKIHRPLQIAHITTTPLHVVRTTPPHTTIPLITCYKPHVDSYANSRLTWCDSSPIVYHWTHAIHCGTPVGVDTRTQLLQQQFMPQQYCSASYQLNKEM